jgi:hypothetical protein
MEETTMSDDLNKKVQQIAQLLGHDDVPDNVKELISLLSTSLEKDRGGDSSSKVGEKVGDSPSETDNSAVSAQPDSSIQNTPAQTSSPPPASEDYQAVNRDVLNTAKSALNRLNAANDPRINLLNAIKPFMNSRRQKKIGNCIQLLQIASLSRQLNEREKQTR